MPGRNKALLLADTSAGEDFAQRLGINKCRVVGDPYELLEAIHQQAAPLVILSAPQNGLEYLCRAIRTLRKGTHIAVVCPPPAEPDVRSMLSKTIDDYFLLPLTDADWRCLQRVLQESPADIARMDSTGTIDTTESHLYAHLVRESRDVQTLKREIAAVVSDRLAKPMQWTDAIEASSLQRPAVLSAYIEGRRQQLVAMTDSTGLDQKDASFLARLQSLLPSLFDAADRCGTLHQLAITDHLTGAYNRRYFYKISDQILLRASQQNLRAAVLLYDIDDFKHYNDTYGHAAGDEILRETTTMIRNAMRQHDIVARIGGDEFAVLVWDSDKPRQADSRQLGDAYELADRFCKTVAQHQFQLLGNESAGTLTISGGLANYPANGTTVRQLLRQADIALGKVKKSGKSNIYLVGRCEADSSAQSD